MRIRIGRCTQRRYTTEFDSAPSSVSFVCSPDIKTTDDDRRIMSPVRDGMSVENNFRGFTACRRYATCNGKIHVSYLRHENNDDAIISTDILCLRHNPPLG
ncbi:MAG: hypothetical protein LBJ67_07980 [Planctomycetaceae bacterium]|nr:hypothetical protein [Planctomycetaceae bacterium]